MLHIFSIKIHLKCFENVSDSFKNALIKNPRDVKNEKECWHHLREYLLCQEVNSTVSVSEKDPILISRRLETLVHSNL